MEAMTNVALTNTEIMKAESASELSGAWIETDAAHFADKFNRVSFALAHHLSSHPLFQLAELMELARRTAVERPYHLHYDAGDVRVDQRWDQVPKKAFSAQEALERIESAGAWVILKHAQRDPKYRVLIEKGMAELKRLIGDDLDPQIKQEDLIIFVTSPRRVSSYHIDRECNFLLQIRGAKTIHVFDQNDREILPEQELERFWTVDNNAPVYKPQLQHRANSYLMQPGSGVHIPVNAPHWVENADNVSISLSVNFQFKDSVRANVYRANHLLRKFGFTPTPPGAKPLRDAWKNHAVGSAMRIRQIFRGESPW
jgi:hypothetical protein